MDKALAAKIRMQNEAEEAIRKANYWASIIVTVGGGKGKIMLDMVKELIGKGKVKSVLYLCDNRRLRDSEEEGFPAEIKKWGDTKMKSMIQLECYQTACRWIDKKFDLVLGDEIDFAITPKYWLAMTNNKFKYAILVSGTLSLEKKQVLQKFAPIVYRFTTNDAEDRGVINKTNYYIYNYKLSEADAREYNRLTKIITALSKGGATFGEPDFDFWIRKRKYFLNGLDSSYLHCRKIMQYIYMQDKTNRVVIFCELTAQADRVCKHSFHGGNEDLDNLAKFQREEINAVSVVAKVKRGINLKRANWAIFESITGSSTEFEQRNGRMKRLPQSEMAGVVFMVPWFPYKNPRTDEITWKPTVVQKWIDKAISNLTNVQFKDLKL